MRRNARYYLGRVVKSSNIDQSAIIEAILDPAILVKDKNRYTFTDLQIIGSNDAPKGIIGKISKYKPEASVQVVMPQEHQVGEESVDNLIEAASPFVYIPEFSGLAYQHVWNHLQKEQFERFFAELILAKYSNFFVICEVDPVVDLRTFTARLSRLTAINSLQAKVRPPNPLFGPCWQSLRDYIKKRNLDEISINEESERGVKTNLAEIAEIILKRIVKPEDIVEKMEPLMGGVGDAAILMAADGYGKAKVIGTEGTHVIVIRTSDNQKSFLLEKEPDPEKFFQTAYEEFQKINKERYLEH